MHTWSPFPFLRITVAFVTGILLYKFIPINFEFQSILLGLGILSILYIGTKLLFKNLNNLSGNIGLITICAVGFTNTFQYDQTNDENHLIHFNEEISGYVAIVNSSVIEKEKYFIYDVNLENLTTRDSIYQKTGIIRLYVKRTRENNQPLTYGDKILVKGSPFRLPEPDNPNEFNYKEYMAGQNIYFQQFVDTKDIDMIGSDPENTLMAWAIDWRRYFSKKIDIYIHGKNESAIAKALILGVKDGLDNEIKKSYSSAGAMHVLAVSGLHAGIIHLILQFLFRPLLKRKPWKYIIPIISICFLWAFAMITGLSPSIMRAVTMFSIIIIGQHYFSRPNVFNSLSLSAFILLFYNPYFLFAVGFQLSYIAVAGIVYLFPIIYALISPNNWLLDKIWSITSVSIAAQIATFPLTIYYFHQFPVYFLLSNLVVIPAAFVIMSSGLLLLANNSFFISDLLGFILEKLIKFLNDFVFYIQKMHLSLIDWLYINQIQTICIYLVVVFLLMLVHYRKMIFMKLILACVLIISVSGFYDVYNQSDVRKLVFYEVKNQSIIDNVTGLNAKLYTVNQPENMELIKHQIEPFRLMNNLNPIEDNIDHLEKFDTITGLSATIWQGKKFLFITQELKTIKAKKLMECDVLVVSNNSVKKLSMLSGIVSFEELIIDSSNDYYTINKLLKEAEKAGIKCRSISQEGAVIFEN